MGLSFDQGKNDVAKLCRYFETNRPMFLAPGVKEAHIRQTLIDPFFMALGWDVHNESQTAPQYREVIPEDSLDVEGHQKAPDYTFRVGSQAKFYTEAKKCGININADPGPAYQLRRYGWSAKVALSLLTDFEELGIYDCTLRPRPSDKASHARIQYYRFEEYPDRWRELWDYFSREAVWSGAFDQYAASKRKRGTSEVDDEFLKEIEGWRDELARNVALRNPAISLEDLNAAVLLTIDRIVFLRMAEDRGIEPYEQLLTLSEQPDIYARFMSDLCRRADRKYNSGLFHFQKESGVPDAPDRITPSLTIDDKAFKPILQSLYFAYGSPYHFGVMPVEILGTVYERFLGKVIRLTEGHQAKIEEKPEVRKAGGVYYTPSYIVDYIVKNTVGKKIEERSPQQLAGGKNLPPFRVLDMACGSGSFLLGAYRCLLDHCLKWYTENKPDSHKKAVWKDLRRGGWRLTIEEKKRILITHIFGVDIDPQAVEVSKLSLLLRVLEGETDQSFGRQMQLFEDRALPNLSDNLKCGNSLIGPDYFAARLDIDPEELKRVNPFDWKQAFPEAMQVGGFDCVIGNPPYLFITELAEFEKRYFFKRYVTAEYRFDVYGLFTELSIKRLVRRNGYLSFIIPHTLLSNDSYEKLRRLILVNTLLEKVIDIGPGVFVGAKNETMIFVAKNSIQHKTSDETQVILTTAKTFPNPSKQFVVKQGDWFDNPKAAWLVQVSKDKSAVIAKIEKAASRLGYLCTINQGLRTGDNEKYLSETKRSGKWKLAAGGKQVGRYKPLTDGLYVYYEPELLDAPRRRELFESAEKLVVQEIRNITLPRRIIATYDSRQFYCLQSTNVINLRESEAGQWNTKFLLGILNSHAANYFFRQSFSGNNHIASNHLAKIPVPSATHEAQDAIVALVDQLLELHKRLAACKSESDHELCQRQINATDAEIDRLVYELFGLTREEIKIVEEGTK
jgi:hypothetical protein